MAEQKIVKKKYTHETVHYSKENGICCSTDLRPVCFLLKRHTEAQFAMRKKKNDNMHKETN